MSGLFRFNVKPTSKVTANLGTVLTTALVRVKGGMMMVGISTTVQARVPGTLVATRTQA